MRLRARTGQARRLVASLRLSVPLAPELELRLRLLSDLLDDNLDLGLRFGLSEFGSCGCIIVTLSRGGGGRLGRSPASGPKGSSIQSGLASSPPLSSQLPPS